VRDTEGRRFSVRCAANVESCAVEPITAAAPARRTRAVLSAGGRLLGVCDAAEAGGAAHPADCRALVCDTDADCPPLPALEAGACVGGSCVNPASALVSQDAIMLCLAGTGPGHEKPNQVERYALALNCGEPCVVPAPCVR